VVDTAEVVAHGFLPGTELVVLILLDSLIASASPRLSLKRQSSGLRRQLLKHWLPFLLLDFKEFRGFQPCFRIGFALLHHFGRFMNLFVQDSEEEVGLLF